MGQRGVDRQGTVHVVSHFLFLFRRVVWVCVIMLRYAAIARDRRWIQGRRGSVQTKCLSVTKSRVGVKDRPVEPRMCVAHAALSLARSETVEPLSANRWERSEKREKDCPLPL